MHVDLRYAPDPLLVTAVCATIGSALIASALGVQAFLMIMLTGLAVFCIYLGQKGILVGLVCTVVIAGMIQGSLAAVTRSSLSLWLDDVCLFGIAVGVVFRLLHQRNYQRLGAGAGLALLIAFAIVTAQDPGSAFYQARQIAVPALLLFTGSVLDKDEFGKIARVLFVVAMVSFGYTALEEFGVRLIDPWAAYGFNQFSTSENALAQQRDLPGNYYYYYGSSADDVFIRSGGLHFNPPGLSIFMGSLALYAKAYAKPGLRVALYVMCGTSVALTVGRAGAIIFLLALFQRAASKVVTRLGFLVGAVAGAVLLNEFFSAQGNSGSHSEGLVYGSLYGLSNPLGGGFGVIGNASESSAEGHGESLFGLFFASSGWPAFVIVFWLVVKAWRNSLTVPGVALTAALIASALSESTSGLAVAAPLWILGGAALTIYKPSDLKSPLQGSASLLSGNTSSRDRAV